MRIRRIKNDGTWVWQARVAYKGRRRASRPGDSKGEEIR